MRSISEFRSTSTAELPSDGLARGVGWLSLGLAATQLVAPRLVLHLIGASTSRRATAVVRLLGLAKLGTGLAVLFRPRRPGPLIARVAHDVLDLGLAEVAGTHRVFGALAIGGVGAVNTIAARRAIAASPEKRVMYSVTINRPADEVYAFFRRFESFPGFMDHIEAVRELDERHSLWIARLPTGRSIEWKARITEDRPGEAIAWESIESPIKTAGRITFAQAPGSDLTEVRVEMKLGLVGRASAALAKLFAKPQIKGDLRRFKQVLETGEVLFSDASAHEGKHPAQPDPEVERRPRVFFPNPPTAAKGVTP